MEKKKVLLDTNILISALGWSGKPKYIFLKCIAGELKLVTSSEQMDELRQVLGYPKFSFSEEQKEAFISIILEIAAMIEITGKVKVIKDDPEDDIILETALVGQADYIISGDPHLLKLKEFAKIKIVTAKDFLENQSL